MQRILVRRTGALGDVIDSTPVFRRLRREYPDAEIDVDTHYPQVFLQNPHNIGSKRGTDADYDRVINLDMAFENRLGQVSHPESYMEVAFGDRADALQLELAFDPDDVPMDENVDWARVITIHPARSWAQRTLPRSFWKKVVAKLKDAGWIVVSTGTLVDQQITGVIDMRGRHSLAQQAALINKSRAFLCGASGLVTLGQCTDAPMVWLETITLPWMSMRERHGVKGWRCYPMTAKVDCVGCYHGLGRPVTYYDCPLGTNACVQAFDPDEVARRVEQAAYSSHPSDIADAHDAHQARARENAANKSPNKSPENRRGEKLNLSNVTLVCIDTVCHELAAMAVKRCMDVADFGAVHIYTDNALKWPLDLPGPWYPTTASSLAEVAHVLWYEVPKHIETSHVLVVQWDSWILNPDCWSDDFLKYDYIGAPWGWHGDGHEVGNGGFSLRSKRLMDALQSQPPPTGINEDDAICRVLRPALERMGYEFAPLEVAQRFSFERSFFQGIDHHFGFHGIFNFPVVLQGDELRRTSELMHANAYLTGSNQLAEFDRIMDQQHGAAIMGGTPTKVAELFEAAEVAVIEGNQQQGLANFDAGLVLDPVQPVAWQARGHLLYSMNRLFEALCSFDWSIAYGLKTAENYSNRTVCYVAMNQMQMAEANVDVALKLNPQSHHALHNKAILLYLRRAYQESVDTYDRLLALPNLTQDWINDARYARSGAHLALEHYEEGWEDNEYRAENRTPLRAHKWRGEPYQALMVLAEQGYGDHIQFLRFAAQLKKQRGGKVYVEMRRPLAPLARSFKGVDGIIAFGEKWPPVDGAVSMMSLPYWLGMKSSDELPDAPYLFADGSEWKKALPPGFKVGLCWASGERPTDIRAVHIQRRKSMQLRQLAPLAQIPGVTFVSLQIDGAGSQVVGDPGITVLDVSSKIDDFSDTADLMMALDLIITVDTASAHLAGALGRPVWIMHRYDVCWRWQSKKQWYASARHFTQTRWGDWSSVVKEVAAALGEVVSNRVKGQYKEMRHAIEMDIGRLGVGGQDAAGTGP